MSKSLLGLDGTSPLTGGGSAVSTAITTIPANIQTGTGAQNTVYVTDMERPSLPNIVQYYPTPLFVVPNITIQNLQTQSGFSPINTVKTLDISLTSKQYYNYSSLVTDFVASLNRAISQYPQNVGGTSPSNGIYYDGTVDNNVIYTIVPVFAGTAAECSSQMQLSIVSGPNAGNQNLYYDQLLGYLFTEGYTNTTISNAPYNTNFTQYNVVLTTVFSGTAMQSRKAPKFVITTRPTGNATLVQYSLSSYQSITFTIAYRMLQYAPGGTSVSFNPLNNGSGTNAGNTGPVSRNGWNAPAGSIVTGNCFVYGPNGVNSLFIGVYNFTGVTSFSTITIPSIQYVGYKTFADTLITAINSDMNARGQSFYDTIANSINMSQTDSYTTLRGSVTLDGGGTTYNPGSKPFLKTDTDAFGKVVISSTNVPVPGTFHVVQNLDYDSTAYPSGVTDGILLDSGCMPFVYDGSLYKCSASFPYDFTTIIMFPQSGNTDIVSNLLGRPQLALSDVFSDFYGSSAICVTLPPLLGYVGNGRPQTGYLPTSAVPAKMPGAFWLSPEPIVAPQPVYGHMLNIGDGQITSATDPVVSIGNAVISTVYTSTLGIQPANSALTQNLNGTYPQLTITAPITYTVLKNSVVLNNYGYAYTNADTAITFDGFFYNGIVTNTASSPNYNINEGCQNITTTNPNCFSANGVTGIYARNDYFPSTKSRTENAAFTATYNSPVTTFYNNDTVPHKYLITHQYCVQNTAAFVSACGTATGGTSGTTYFSNYQNLQLKSHNEISGTGVNAGLHHTDNWVITMFPGDCFMLLICAKGSTATYMSYNSNQAISNTDNGTLPGYPSVVNIHVL